MAGSTSMPRWLRPTITPQSTRGSGADIWGTEDAFRYVYQSLNGDGQIVARVGSLQNTHPNAKAGLMIRETLAPSSRHAIINVTPGAGIEFMRRLAPGALTDWSGVSGAPPAWIKLVRQGSNFAGYVSGDGTTWTLVGSETIAMAGNVYVGLAVTSHDNVVLCTGMLDSVAVTAVPVQTPSSTELLLRDDFTDNARDTTRWYRGVLTDYAYSEASVDAHFSGDMLVTALEQNQRLEITPRTNASGLRYNGYVSTQTYKFIDKYASVEVIEAPNAASYAGLTFAAAIDHANFYRFVIENGWLRFDDAVNNERNQTIKIAFNPLQHKYLRLRHDPGQNSIVWETAPDGTNWTVQRSISATISLTAVRMEISAGTWQKESQPGRAVLDNFRLEQNPFQGSNAIPVASPGGPYLVTAGQSVQFNGNGSYDRDGVVASYQWTFGDGTLASGANPVHAYQANGKYNVTLKVTDGVSP